MKYGADALRPALAKPRGQHESRSSLRRASPWVGLLLLQRWPRMQVTFQLAYL